MVKSSPTNPISIQAFEEAREFFIGLKTLYPDAKFSDLLSEHSEWLDSLSDKERTGRKSWLDQNRKYEKQKTRKTQEFVKKRMEDSGSPSSVRPKRAVKATERILPFYSVPDKNPAK